MNKKGTEEVVGVVAAKWKRFLDNLLRPPRPGNGCKLQNEEATT